MTIVAGVDFGTQSVRFSIFDSDRGRLGSGVANYPVLRRADDANHASQRHVDHLTALESAAKQAIVAANIDARQIAALGIDTTGSTIVPVDENLQPLDDYYLWCDHRGWREAEAITKSARDQKLPHLDWCGGTYSPEFGWSKLWHWLKSTPEKRSRFATAVEHCDLMTALLCGISRPDELPRSVCAMGHKWLWNESLGGFPPDNFFTGLDHVLTGARNRLTGNYMRSDAIAGHLCGEWAKRLGLRAGIPIPVAALDAHWDAIGAGIRLGDIVNVIGTSTCVMAISETPTAIPGVFGVVNGSIHPSYAGIEAGLSAAGDIFDAIARRAGTNLTDLAAKIENHRAGQTGLLRLVWDHGDRTVLAQPHLSGVTFGLTLATTAADELFAAIEGTALHTRIIIERLAEHGVPVKRLIHAGGIPRKSPVLNRIYASALGVPVLLPKSDTISLGSAIFAFLAAGTFKTVEDAQQSLCPEYDVIQPDSAAVETYNELFHHFRTLYFSLGREDSVPVAIGGLLPALHRIATLIHL
ncbi:MAG TPA: ribulokinase [Pirellulaceae bacterium]|jgi:L-ribulokinase